jgi:hypothetical protein
LDKSHSGLLSVQQIAKEHFLRQGLPSILLTNNTKVISNTVVNNVGNNTIQGGYISIDKQLKPLLIKIYENLTAFNLSKCNTPPIADCALYYRSLSSLTPTLSIIGNVSIGILLLKGENDSLTPVQQAFLLQQRLTEVNHPDHTMITYPNSGHYFYPSSQWLTSGGPIPYVLADLYAWLEAHSCLSLPYGNTTVSTIGGNIGSLNTNTTSLSSSSCTKSC